MKTLLSFFPLLAFCQVPEVTTNIQLENLVFYMDQHGDSTRIGKLPGPTPPDPQLFGPLRRYAIVADITSVGGKPAAGTFLAQGVTVAPSTASEPVPNTMIVDFTRNQMHNMILEIMTPDKVQVGALYGFWMGAGASAPGFPAGSGVLAILGGTGAYLGVRGQGTNVAASGLRVASMREDMSRRRVNGGGRLNLGIRLTDAALAEVTSAAHEDFTPVTTSRPARAGEVITIQVRAAWPVQPALPPGQVFAQDPISRIAVPVEAFLNDAPIEVLTAVAWPGTHDRYRIDVRIPSGLTPGSAKLQVYGAYLPGVAYSLPVQ